MVITDYRVQSVLRTYSRELQRSRLVEKSPRQTGGAEPNTEKVSISGEGKRTLMMDRLTNQVLEKMLPKQDDAGQAGLEPPAGNEPAAEGNK